MALTRRTFVAAALVGAAGCVSTAGEVSLDGDDVLPVPVAGDPDADVTVAVFEDFACGACQHYKRNVFPQIWTQYVEPGEIRYEHRDFPIPVDGTWSWVVADAARSVQDRYDDAAFWEFSSAIYEHQANYSADVIESVADDLGFDGEAVREDAEAGRFRDDLEAERERADDAGVSGTPTVVVDGETVDPDPDEIQAAIEDAL